MSPQGQVIQFAVMEYTMSLMTKQSQAHIIDSTCQRVKSFDKDASNKDWPISTFVF
jgi:hypothetical protein